MFATNAKKAEGTFGTTLDSFFAQIILNPRYRVHAGKCSAEIKRMSDLSLLEIDAIVQRS
jgi:hypothetical protein